jgi:acrylyl-CoA reductase (NADPH)
MVPGIDLAGRVVESNSDEYSTGDKVVLTGWGIGERHWGGYAELARVRSEWLVRKPTGLTLKQTMQIGTAGFTAMLCALGLEDQGVEPDGPEILVTGASGGVGGMAVVILSRMGYNVVASTGRAENADYLKRLGATDVIGRDGVIGPLGKPLESQRWGGAVDSVGGKPLAEILKAVKYGGAVSACGLAAGPELETTVYPFILRGVKLIGIDSGMCPIDRRVRAWNRLAEVMPHGILDSLTRSATLDDLVELSEEVIGGQVRGRYVVELTR